MSVCLRLLFSSGHISRNDNRNTDSLIFQSILCDRLFDLFWWDKSNVWWHYAVWIRNLRHYCKHSLTHVSSCMRYVRQNTNCFNCLISSYCCRFYFQFKEKCRVEIVKTSEKSWITSSPSCTFLEEVHLNMKRQLNWSEIQYLWRHLRKPALCRDTYRRPWPEAARNARRLTRAYDICR